MPHLFVIYNNEQKYFTRGLKENTDYKDLFNKVK